MQTQSVTREGWYMTVTPDNTDIVHLDAHIIKHLSLLAEAVSEITAAQRDDLPKLGRTPRAAVMIAGLLENYYTCAETVFVRISQFFGNHLTADRWHRELLERMCLEIPSLRPRLLSDATYNDLLELMRFRHFKRYYFGTAYDWERIDALLRRIERLAVQLPTELQAFRSFLHQLNME